MCCSIFAFYFPRMFKSTHKKNNRAVRKLYFLSLSRDKLTKTAFFEKGIFILTKEQTNFQNSLKIKGPRKIPKNMLQNIGVNCKATKLNSIFYQSPKR